MMNLYIVIALLVPPSVSGSPQKVLDILTNNNPQGGNAGIGRDENFDAITFLERAGYLDDLDGVRNRHHAPDNIKQALKEFQQFAGIPVTSRLDPETVKTMKRPRCGVPDVIKPSQRPSHTNNITNEINAPLAYTTKSKWHKNLVTYKFISFTSDLTKAEIRSTVAQAFRTWSAVIPIDFRETTGEADIDIKFTRKDHGSPCRPFDGPGGVLAHAYYPGDSLSGDLHFDDDETWTLNTKEGTNLLHIATHELGHSLGLGHSADPQAVLTPYYQGNILDLHLSPDDIKGIQSLYGPRHGGSRHTDRPHPTPKATSKPTGRYCDMNFDAIEQIHNGGVNAFVGEDVYAFTDKGLLLYGKIGGLFKGAPNSPGAVVYDRYNKKLFFFKGSQYWRFTEYSMDSGYPKTLPRDFWDIDAALQGDDTAIYVFQGSKFARWNERLTSYGRGFPIATSNYYGGDPSNIEASFHASNGYTFFFKNKKYWKYTMYNGRRVLAPNFPKDMRPFWLGCGQLTDEDKEVFAGSPGKK